MAGVSIKRVVADAIASYISTNIAGLTGLVSAVSAGPEVQAPCLAVKIISDKFRFEPSQSDELYWIDEDSTDDDPIADDGKVVLDVGSFTGTYTIQLFAANVPERELYEQKILDLFLETLWAPGTIFVTTPALIVNGYASLHTAQIKARLESEEWSEEFSFESRRYSFLDIYIDYPALTTDDAATMTSLQLALASTSATVTTIADIPAANRVEVQEDGSVGPATL